MQKNAKYNNRMFKYYTTTTVTTIVHKQQHNTSIKLIADRQTDRLTL